MIQYIHIYIIPPQSSDVEPVKKRKQQLKASEVMVYRVVLGPPCINWPYFLIEGQLLMQGMNKPWIKITLKLENRLNSFWGQLDYTQTSNLHCWSSLRGLGETWEIELQYKWLARPLKAINCLPGCIEVLKYTPSYAFHVTLYHPPCDEWLVGYSPV